MSYLVFARKYRPQNFDEVIGQEHITKSLTNAVLSGKLGQAYIFSGPRGVGKTSCARILSKSLNCKHAPTPKPCGKCPACCEISQGRSLDVLEIDGASNTGVDDVRELREAVKYAPSAGTYKIYIIDEVHMLSTSAFNALLKTLEEPPPHAKFIFATTALHKVLPTIRSRCQRFEFRPIPALAILEKLGQIVKKEHLTIEKNALFAIAKASEGSLRDAESMLDQLSSFSKTEITLNDVTSVLGSIKDELLMSLVDKIIQRDAPGALDIVDNFVSQGKDPLVFVASLIEYFRDLMIAKTANARLNKLLDMPQYAQERITEQAKRISLAEILNSVNILVDTQEMFKRVDSRRIPLEVGVIRLAGGLSSNPGRIPSNKESQIRKTESTTKPPLTLPPDQAEPKTNPAPVQSHNKSKEEMPKAKEIKAHPEKAVALDHILKIWQATIEGISKVKMSIATYLSEGDPLRVEDNVLFIGFPQKLKFHKDVLEKKENSKFIEQNLSQALDTRLKVSFVFCEDKSSEKEIEIEPNIKSTIEAFKGKIVNRSRSFLHRRETSP